MSSKLIAYIKAGDYVVIAAVLSIVAIIAMRPVYTASSAKNIKVQTIADNYIYPLHGEERLIFNGPIGKTVIKISDKDALFLSSECKDQLCVRKGVVSQPGEWIACLPNGVSLLIVGSPLEYDVESY